MRRITWVVAIVMCLAVVLAGCGKKDSTSVVKDLDKVMNKLDSYHGTGKMVLHTGLEPQEYGVEVSYQAPHYYRISLTNEKKDITQIVLRNDDGVFVLTPHLNKSFRFQSDWPENQGQVYLFQSLAQSILMDNERQFTADKDAYVFDVQANYQNGSLARQKVWLNKKSLAPQHVEVSDANSNVMVIVDFKDFQFGKKFEKDSFDMQRNMTSYNIQLMPTMGKAADNTAQNKTPQASTDAKAATGNGAAGAAGTNKQGTAATGASSSSATGAADGKTQGAAGAASTDAKGAAGQNTSSVANGQNPAGTTGANAQSSTNKANTSAPGAASPTGGNTQGAAGANASGTTPGAASGSPKDATAGGTTGAATGASGASGSPVSAATGNTTGATATGANGAVTGNTAAQGTGNGAAGTNGTNASKTAPGTAAQPQASAKDAAKPAPGAGADASKAAAAAAKPQFGVLEPSYIPSGVKKQDIRDMKLGEEMAVMLRYSGKFNYTLVESMPQAQTVSSLPGDIVDLGFTLAVITGDEKKTMMWTSDGVEFRLSTGDLPLNEMIKVAQALEDQSGK
ncbi:LolA family protein [Paenibacillus thalictri]|uniref:LolA family protein n=1 Tax=Paenibacillus thalictri TaxID=2527873 RepID=UPI00197F9AC2